MILVIFVYFTLKIKSRRLYEAYSTLLHVNISLLYLYGKKLYLLPFIRTFILCVRVGSNLLLAYVSCVNICTDIIENFNKHFD